MNIEQYVWKFSYSKIMLSFISIAHHLQQERKRVFLIRTFWKQLQGDKGGGGEGGRLVVAIWYLSQGRGLFSGTSPWEG